MAEDEQQQRTEEALRILGTPIGRALMQEGTTFRRWASSPSNLWVESKAGRYLLHSDHENARCPVRGAYATWRPVLLAMGALGGEQVLWRLDGALIALVQRQKLERIAGRQKGQANAPKARKI